MASYTSIFNLSDVSADFVQTSQLYVDYVYAYQNSTITLNNNIIPYSANTINLGSLSYPFQDVYSDTSTIVSTLTLSSITSSLLSTNGSGVVSSTVISDSLNNLTYTGSTHTLAFVSSPTFTSIVSNTYINALSGNIHGASLQGTWNSTTTTGISMNSSVGNWSFLGGATTTNFWTFKDTNNNEILQIYNDGASGKCLIQNGTIQIPYIDITYDALIGSDITFANASSSNGLISYYANANQGGLMFSSDYGNMYFIGGNTSNSWNFFDSLGNRALIVYNNGSTGYVNMNNGVLTDYGTIDNTLTSTALIYSSGGRLTNSTISGNLQFSGGGELDTIQDIDTGATPTFANIVLPSFSTSMLYTTGFHRLAGVTVSDPNSNLGFATGILSFQATPTFTGLTSYVTTGNCLILNTNQSAGAQIGFEYNGTGNFYINGSNQSTPNFSIYNATTFTDVLKISGNAVSTMNNVLDDGAGNMIISGTITSSGSTNFAQFDISSSVGTTQQIIPTISLGGAISLTTVIANTFSTSLTLGSGGGSATWTSSTPSPIYNIFTNNSGSLRTYLITYSTQISGGISGDVLFFDISSTGLTALSGGLSSTSGTIAYNGSTVIQVANGGSFRLSFTKSGSYSTDITLAVLQIAQMA